ncbi:hypothetical protein [Leptospira borgpetersenii]|uniref:Uncharacterized protein n=1 Tax=Leptospira borgpetersenii serovar Hardjo-bovis str. Sponselee TaxID=1303729 RepID=M6BVD6_LEPBO|nr:hypothetical protein [Leptospira borgpetersenii]EMJ83504.1 hypothetical protein LEP1GSC016_1879 [Leptospira borgpetersenii serovar Hardjo-bovis str. Sponselee]MBE8351968.1 hypothetical protein [Leptospira borgpetersenii serovar Hardjo-bovis]MBE8375203.1 hypothetical protein [Leptospira borgpetersenii serovar Hardjo-bovis]MBE8381283.1 hypothetical protein [Leptospira borgpetersenii serovar Hardjo-bovis]MBE8384344.1 hypothetical protein [Leptospira borgpetersenii serovar Hardjo-bovis]
MGRHIRARLRTLGSKSYYNFKQQEKTTNATVSVGAPTFLKTCRIVERYFSLGFETGF